MTEHLGDITNKRRSRTAKISVKAAQNDSLNIQHLIIKKKRTFERKKLSMEIFTEGIKPK